jgi:hypothetical protein
VKDDV